MDIRDNLGFIKNKIENNKINLERAKILNEQIESLSIRCVELNNLLESIYDYVNNLAVLKNMTVSEANEFKARRINYLNDSITEELHKIFPEEEFVAKIECKFNYNSNKAYLTLRDKQGNLRIPKMSEGKLCQYLISFAGTVGTIKGLGKHNIYIDEAFGVSSSVKLLELNTILEQVLESGIQIILVSQRSELYQDIPRREFHLQKSYDSSDLGVSSVLEVVDIE